MQLEPVSASDAATLQPMMLRTIATSVPVDATERQAIVANVIANMRWAFDHPQQCVHLKCTDDGRLIGVILVKNFWNLCSLFVEPDSHGRGVGRSLLQEAIRQCSTRSERPDMRVNAAPNAVGFYRAMGFTTVDETRRLVSITPMSLSFFTSLTSPNI
jgi:GNAT superfamily N-acetyltransferase